MLFCLGNPLRVRLTAGQRHDSTQAQAQALLDGFTFARVIVDRGYAAAAFVASIQARGSEAVIPPHQRAKVKRAYDTWLYGESPARGTVFSCGTISHAYAMNGEVI